MWWIKGAACRWRSGAEEEREEGREEDGGIEKREMWENSLERPALDLPVMSVNGCKLRNALLL